jgi:hypothetical protein
MFNETITDLLNLGFTISEHFAENDVTLSGCGYTIRIRGDESGVDYAAVDSNGRPVSWHTGSRRCNEPGRWTGTNYHITRVPEEELSGVEYDIWNAMRFHAHAGHYVTDLAMAW